MHVFDYDFKNMKSSHLFSLLGCWLCLLRNTMVETATLGTTKQLTFTVGRSDKKFCCANTCSIVDDALRAHMSLVCQPGL